VEPSEELECVPGVETSGEDVEDVEVVDRLEV